MDDGTITAADLAAGALAEAAARIGVKENQRTKNSGLEVDEYLRAVGLGPGYAWCSAFVYYCSREAARNLHATTPVPRTAGALKMWALADAACRSQTPAVGAVIVLDHGDGKGHVGFVEAVHDDGSITSIEGNTNEAGSREGNAVARHSRWRPQDGKRGVLKGYLDFSRATVRPAIG